MLGGSYESLAGATEEILAGQILFERGNIGICDVKIIKNHYYKSENYVATMKEESIYLHT